jgi:PAS domain S-box-containing protein
LKKHQPEISEGRVNIKSKSGRKREALHKQAEEALQRYELLARHSRDIILFMRRDDGRIMEANAAATRAYGYSHEELLARSIYDLRAPETQRMTADQMAEADHQGILFETFHRRKDGSTFPVEVSSQGATISATRTLISVVRDITERKRAEEELQQGHERFRLLAEATFEGIAFTEEGRILEVNDQLARMLGYRKDELIGAEVRSVVFPEDRPRVLENIQKGRESTIEHRFVRKDGVVITVEAHGKPFTYEGRGVRLTALRDITERKQAEEALQLSEEAALRLAQETGVIAEIGCIISSSLDIEEVYERFAEAVRKLIPFDLILVNLVNQQGGTMTTAYAAGMEVAGRRTGLVVPIAGSVTEQMIRTGAPILFQPESIEEVHNRFPGLVLSFQAGLRSRLSVPLITRSEVIGSMTVWSKQEKAYGERDIRLAQGVAGQVAGAIANAQLFRERKRAEEKLRESEESYRSLVETSPDAIFLHEEGRFVYLNPAAVRLYGAGNAEELYGKIAFDIVHPDDREVIRSRTDSIMTTGVPAPLKEIRILRRDGSAVDVEATAGVSYYRGRNVIQVIQRDITERKRAEEKIKVSLKEKEVLLQEIHHRVKNNLQIISSLLYLQASRTEHPGAVSALQESRNRIRSMALIHETLYQSPNLASINMGAYTRNLVSDLQHSYRIEKRAIGLRLNIEDIPLGITEAIPCGLIVNELVSNALKHAFPMERAGEIIIGLHRGSTNQVTLTVSDNGIGFPEQMDFRKSPSLGLTLINSLVQQLGGTIELDRSGGTTFTIMFG